MVRSTLVTMRRATVARRRLHVLPVVEQLDLALYRNRLAVQRVRLTADGRPHSTSFARSFTFRDRR